MQADKKREDVKQEVKGAKDTLLKQNINARIKKEQAKQEENKPSTKTESFNDEDLKEKIKENQNLFSRRLQKSKIKDLDRQIRLQKIVAKSQPDSKSDAVKKLTKMQDEFKMVKKEVFTDERKIEQRKQGFQKAKLNIKKTQMSEFEM